MAGMRFSKITAAFICLLMAGSLIAGCGDSDDSISSGTTSAENRPAPPKSAFPSAKGKTLAELVNSTDGPSELVVLPAGITFFKGENRFSFAVFKPDRTPVTDAEVALYVAQVPEPKVGKREKRGKGPVARARDEALNGPAIGPFPASVESIATQPAFRAKTTSDDPDAAMAVYSTQVDFPAEGEWRMAALIKTGDETTTTLLSSANVGEQKRLPRVGEKAPLIHTPTPEDVGGDLSQLTTRIPPDTQNRVDYADALGKEPIVLLFATPQFCESRVCGPVVDVAEQVKEVYGDEAAFIHMEIYNDNDPSKSVRPQVKAFHLPSEPWVFVIDKEGTIRAQTEGAFGVDRLTKAVKEVVGE